MTARDLYFDALIELNKVQAPSLILEEYNYFLNKAISQYINLSYNSYDAAQISSDNLRVLKATQSLKPKKIDDSVYGGGVNYDNIWEVELPPDYYHILNCLVTFGVKKKYSCYDQGTTVEFPARRLTSDMWAQVINNAYMRPSYKVPYFFIHNVNTMNTDGTYNLPTNAYSEEGGVLGKGTDPKVNFPNTDSNVTVTVEDGKIVINNNEVIKKVIDTQGLSRKVYSDLYSDYGIEEDQPQSQRLPGHRYGNHSTVRMEIRYGNDASIFEPLMVRVDYLKTPQYIRLTQEQLDRTEDTSQIIEFPDYVCQEIINVLVKLIMENASDPRLQTNMAINQTIATPGQQQAQ